MVDNWAELSIDEKQRMSSLNNFSCTLHLLVASSTLLQWELIHFQNSVGAATLFSGTKKSESGIIRLVRTVCKALCKHGSEQSGVYRPFTSFLASKGVKKNPLVSFRGNRFNIVFYDAGALCYLRAYNKVLQ